MNKVLIKCSDNTLVTVSLGDYHSLKATYPDLKGFQHCPIGCGNLAPMGASKCHKCKTFGQAQYAEYLAALRTRLIYG